MKIKYYHDLFSTHTIVPGGLKKNVVDGLNTGKTTKKK